MTAQPRYGAGFPRKTEEHPMWHRFEWGIANFPRLAVGAALLCSIGLPPGLAAADTPSTCSGDCNGDTTVSVDEIITLVNLALGNGDVASCPAGDANGDSAITVDEIVAAVTLALTGCTAAATPTATPSPPPTLTPTVTPTADPELAFVSDDEFARRKSELLAAATSRLRPGSMTNVLAHLERDATDPSYDAPDGAVPADAWDGIFTKITNLKDTSDFDVLMLVNALYRFAGHPMLDPIIWQRAEEAVLGFKYWYTQAGPEGVVDHMWYWTENHLIMFHTIEYLAGQRYPDRVFTHTGMTGTEHMAAARARLLDWFELRSRFGFSEFLSNVYYAFDLRPLLTLAEFADDDELVRLAQMTIDLLTYDLAVHTFRGAFGVPHGRSFKSNKTNATRDSTFEAVKFLYETTALDFPDADDGTAILFALSSRYRVPRVLQEIAAEPGPFANRQRMGIFFDEFERGVPAPHPNGFGYDSEEDLTIWWSMSNLTAWQVVPATLDLINTYNLWDTDGFRPFRAVRDLTALPGIAQTVALNLAHSISMPLLKQVNLYTYRTADYMLASAQDYRPGSRSNEGHFWQATFDHEAVVFTQHPGIPPVESANWSDDGEPGQWTGTASIPRSGQFENVAIHIYAPQYRSNPSPPFDLITVYEDYTHAFFPQERFDEVVRDGHWTFGRKGDGYIALYSWRLAEFVDYAPNTVATDGMVQPFDLRAEGGARNVWIAEMGSTEQSGSFADFQAAVRSATVEVTQIDDVTGLPPRTLVPVFAVRYESPSQGTLEYGWTGNLRVNGRAEPVGDYLRYDNPWGQDEFDTRRNRVARGERELLLDFAARVRNVR